jgi:hypothetical protein
VAVIKFQANGRDLEFDPDHILFSEAAAFRRYTGEAFIEWSSLLDAGREDAMQAIVWIAAKRREPELTFAEVGEWEYVTGFASFIEAVLALAAEKVAEGGEEPDPTAPAESDEPKTSTSSD